MCKHEIDVPMPSTYLTEEKEEMKRLEEEPSRCRKAWKWTVDFYFTYEFLVLVVVAILLAKAYPQGRTRTQAGSYARSRLMFCISRS